MLATGWGPVVTALSPKCPPQRRPKGRGTGSGHTHLVGVAELGHLVRMIERLKKRWETLALPHPTSPSLASLSFTEVPPAPQNSPRAGTAPLRSTPPPHRPRRGCFQSCPSGQQAPGREQSEVLGLHRAGGDPKGLRAGPGAGKDGEKVKGTALSLPYLLQRRSLGAAGFELEDGLVGHRGGRTVKAPEPGVGGEQAEITPPTPCCQPGGLRCFGWVRPS